MKVKYFGLLLVCLAVLSGCGSKNTLHHMPSHNTYKPTAGTIEDFEINVGHRVYFGFDRYDIDDIAAQTLKSQAEWLQHYPYATIIVEGHCDVRGTRQYNIGLGERRAYAVKKYLMSLGIQNNRITVISYGKDQPEAVGNMAEDHAQNRRAVSKIQH